MKRFSTLVILFLALCAAVILLTRGCAKEKEPEPTPPPVTTPAPEDTEPTPTPVPTPEPTPSILGPVWVTSEGGVNLRRSPGTDSDIIVAVDKGTELERTGMADNGWSKILYNDIECYVDSNYVTSTPPAELTTDGAATASFNVTACNDTVWTTDGVNLRRGPGTNYDIALSVETGTELRRTGTTDNNWSRVIYQNVGYYVDSSYVSTTAPVNDETEEGGETAETETAGAEAETSGEFRSNTGTPMDLVVRWSVAPSDSGKKLTLNAYVSSLTLQAEPFADDLTFKVGSNTFNVTSKAVNVESGTAVETLLGTCTADVDQASVPVTVTWHFNGTYNGTELQDVAATANLNLGA